MKLAIARFLEPLTLRLMQHCNSFNCVGEWEFDFWANGGPRERWKEPLFLLKCRLWNRLIIPPVRELYFLLNKPHAWAYQVIKAADREDCPTDHFEDYDCDIELAVHAEAPNPYDVYGPCEFFCFGRELGEDCPDCGYEVPRLKEGVTA